MLLSIHAQKIPKKQQQQQQTNKQTKKKLAQSLQHFRFTLKIAVFLGVTD